MSQYPISTWEAVLEDRAARQVISELLSGVQSTLGAHLVAMYLEGSIATGDFDADSDIDFIVVTDHEIMSETFAALKAMHARITTSAMPWATEIEGSYISRDALWRYDPAHARHPNIQRGRRCVLEMVNHDYAGVIHRQILREHGITLFGPEPQALVAPISPDEVRHAARAILREWGGALLDASVPFRIRGYQSFTVLSICRILYTVDHGAVASKRVAARWMEERDARWAPLIERAWVGRANPSGPLDPDDVRETLEMVRYASTMVR